MQAGTVDHWRRTSTGWRSAIDASGYDRAAPNLFNYWSHHDEFRTWFLQEMAQPHIQVPPQDIYWYDNAIVYDDTLVLASNGEPAPLSLMDRLNTVAPELPNNLPAINGEAIFLFKAGKDNYGHVLAEMLPKLEVILRTELAGIPFILPPMTRQLDTMVTEVLDLVCRDRFPLYRIDGSAIRVGRLYVPGPVSKHTVKTKSATVTQFADRIVSAYGISREQTGRRIYLSRRGFPNRPMINESEVEELAMTHGFDIVVPESLSFRQQVEVFAKADMVLGPLGAGLTSIMFAPDGARIGMIDMGICDAFFYDLACLRRQNFAWLFNGESGPFEFAKLHDPWTCDTDVVRIALRSFFA